MVVISKDWKSAVTLYAQQGHRYCYASMADLVSSLGATSFWNFRAWYLSSVGPAHRVFDYAEVTPYGVERVYCEYRYVMRNAAGELVSLDAFRAANLFHRPRYPKVATAAPGMPVPGKGRRRRSKVYRHVRTRNESRANAMWLSDEPPPRAKRRKLPTYWDDIYRRPQRSWKANRAHQWKG